MERRPWRTIAAIVTLLAAAGPWAQPPIASAATSPFTDIDGTTFEADIEWLWAEGITAGCTATRYCPADTVTRGQMAAFLDRMFRFPTTTKDAFLDDEGSTYEVHINRLAAAGITSGCSPTKYCPKAPVRRDEMASFIARAAHLNAGAGRDYFTDDDGTTHEIDIDRLAASGVVTGCKADAYCPAAPVTRGQMAAFLHRVREPREPLPPPVSSLYVDPAGSDQGNYCLVEADPCRSVGHALSLTLDGDTLFLGAGTYVEGGLSTGDDLTISGDPSGGSTIDSRGSATETLLHVRPEAIVTLDRVALVGEYGRVIRNLGALTVVGSTITGGLHGGGVANFGGTLVVSSSTIFGNVAEDWGGAIYSNLGSAAITNSTIAGNEASAYGGGAIHVSDATLTITNSTIAGNEANAYGGGISASGTYALHIRNSIVAGNTSGAGGDVGCADEDLSVVDCTIASEVASIVGVPAGLSVADILDPAGLQANGGPTQTIALTDSAANPAIDMGDAGTCAAAPVNGLDQRGEPRTPPCDIGAYEVQR